MPPTRFSFFRFSLTFGLLFLLFLVLLTVGYSPLRNHVIETQRITSLKAKSLVLGYQTPDFKSLAQNLLENHVFNSTELHDYRAGRDYLSFYKKASELFPNNFEFFYMQGICYFWMGDLPSAESNLRQSLQINPVFFWSYYNLGLLYLKNGKIDAAIELFSIARHVTPPITQKFLHDLQAFWIIWRYMPNPESTINSHLQEADQKIDYLLLIALAIKNHSQVKAPFDPNQWNPIFF